MPESIITPAAAGGASSLLVVAISLMGPILGPYVLIIASSIAGALWPLSAATTLTRTAGAWLLLRCAMTSVFLTGIISGIIHDQYGLNVDDLLAPVALCIGAMGDGWRPVFGAVSDFVQMLANKFGGKGDSK